MSGPSFWEFLLLCLIGLVVLGPKRLPQVANQIGNWVGQARRMTRTLKRQLEEELELDKPIRPRPTAHHAPPRDDDTYSPAHVKSPTGAPPPSGEPAKTAPAGNPEIPPAAPETDSEERQKA